MCKLTEKTALSRSRAVCLDNVKNLNCWGNELEDISLVRKMINLEVLNISVNNVTTLKDLSYCPRLKELYLRKNQIQSLEELKYLKNLPCLKVLWLSDNPCAIEENYRETVLRNLPQLAKLDSAEVSLLETEKAFEAGLLFDVDDEMPCFEGLDLNRTLTLNAVESCIKQNKSVGEQKPSLSQREEEKKHNQSSEKSMNILGVIPHTCNSPEIKKLPAEACVTKSVNIDDVNRRRVELGIKRLDIGCSTSVEDIETNITKTSQLSKSLVKTQPAKKKHSHILDAVFLLLNELDDYELEEVIQTATSKLQETSDNKESDEEIVQRVSSLKESVITE